MIPFELKLLGAGVGLVALAFVAFTVEKHGYDRGVAVTQAAYEKQLAAQAAANKAAIDGANKQLIQTSDSLSKANQDLDNALAKIDASADGAGGTLCGLDAGRVSDLNSLGNGAD